MSEAVTQMDQSTQQNAALVEESAAAAESLRTQAGQLVQAMSVFTVQGSHHSAPAAIVRAAATVAPKAAPAAAATTTTTTAAKSWPQEERRGENRAKNVARLPAKPAAAPKIDASAATTGTDDWETF